MTTAQELVDFIEITVLTPIERNPRLTGNLKKKLGFTRMNLKRLARKNKPESIVRYVLNAIASPRGINTYREMRKIGAITFEDVVSILLLLYRQG